MLFEKSRADASPVCPLCGRQRVAGSMFSGLGPWGVVAHDIRAVRFPRGSGCWLGGCAASPGWWTSHQTALWSLIGAFAGAVLGFLLTYWYDTRMRRRQYRQRLLQASERVKRAMHALGSGGAIRRLADLLPIFEERDQLTILSDVVMESSINAGGDDLTLHIIEELRWICRLYEGLPGFVPKSKADANKVKAIQNILWETATNAVEYRQSEQILEQTFGLLSTLDEYSVSKGYWDRVRTVIDLYRSLGRLSVGTTYAESGYKVFAFEPGIMGSKHGLARLAELLGTAHMDSASRDRLLSGITEAGEAIDNEATSHGVGG